MITYGSTTLTSYNTITKIEVYYYKSTSATSLSGGSWSTTKPTWENGKYIWQKIKTTYEGKLENGQYYSESDPVNITGQQGATGAAAYSYKLNASDTTVTVSKDGTYSKTSVTFSATSKQGTGAVGAYAGRFKIETTANGTTWTTQYTSSVNESSKNYTIPTGILNIRCSLYQAGGTSVLLDIVSVAIVTDGKDGTNGTNGLNNARVILYRRFSAAPSGTDIAPTGNVTYTFSTGVAANNLNSWTQNIPTGTDPVYMIAASASNTGATDTIAKTEWSTPIKILENGTNGNNGIDGYNQATIYLYQRKSGTAPAKPSSAVTYTFSTGALSSTPSGWSRTIPANDGNPCYVTTATAVAKTTTYSIPASGWSDVVILSQDGEDGVSVTNVTSTNNTADGGTSVVTITLSDGTTKTFNVKNGTKGNTGATAQWYYGTSLTHTSGTATLVATNTSGAVVGSMYLNTQTSLVYKCTAVGTNNTWTYAGDLTTGVIDNIEIGGRNLLYSTPKTYSATAYGAYEFELTEPLKAAQTYTIQLWNIDVSHSAKTAEQLGVNVYYCGSSVTFGGWIGTEYFINGHADHLSLTFTPTEANINHSDVTGAVKKFIRIYNSVPSVSGTLNMSIEKWQLEKGNKATDWSFAPEDVDINNINIGGRNLLYNTATMPAVSNGDKGWRASGGTVTHIDLIDPPIYNVTGAIRVTNNDSTAKQIGMAQDKIKNKFIAGEKYTQSCWIRASENLQAYMTLIWISNSQTTGSSYVKTGGYYNITTDWTYIKIEGIELNGTQATSYSAGYVYGLNVPANGWFEVCGMKLEKGNKATDWTPAPEDTQADIDTALAQSVEYIIGTQTAATNLWTGVTKDASLQVGKTIVYYLPYAGTTSAATLNLTLAGGGTTGAKNVRWNNTNVTNHYPQYSIITLTYDGTYWRTSAYNSDTTNKTRLQNIIIAAENITAGHIICGTSSGYQNIAPYIDFDLSMPILYAGSSIAKGATSGTRDNNYLANSGVNASTNGTIELGTIGKILYLKGTITGNTFHIAATPFMTTNTPNQEDDFYYIPLGIMYTTTNIYFQSSNRLYAYIDGAFQPVDTAAVLRAQDAKDRATAVYGTCSTGATTVDKVVTCSNFTLFDGARIQITFTNANTAIASEATTASPTLNVNGTGRKPIKIGIEEANTANPLYWAAGATIEFVYDGSAWVLQNAPYTLYGTCNTEENVREKQVVCDGAVVCKGTTIYVDMLYSNTADSNSENGNVTLNVANTIAKTIYANNATLTIRSRYNWNAGENPSFTFDGQYWQMDKDTVPAYITDKDEDGIFVHPINDTVSGWSIGKVFELLNNGYSYIKMWLEDVTDNLSAKIRIGREDQHHILLDKEIIQFKKGNTPEELASFSSSGISFDEGVPFKIGNDSTYVQFVDNNSDGVADALEIVADKISFKNGGNNTVQDIQERFNDLQTDISNITNNIEINPTADTPYVAITTQKNEYNAGLKLEPTQLSFQLNGQTTATIANDEMNIPTASVTNLFMQSANQSYEKIWVMRSNGHLSLKVGKQN